MSWRTDVCACTFLPQIPFCTGLLAQVAQLPQLAWLEFSCNGISESAAPDMLTVLSCLSGSLTRLGHYEADDPPCLAALTRLQHLTFWDNGDAHHVTAALPHLTQLTCLVRR